MAQIFMLHGAVAVVKHRFRRITREVIKMIQSYLVSIDQDEAKKWNEVKRYYDGKVTINDIRTALRMYFYAGFYKKGIRVKKVKSWMKIESIINLGEIKKKLDS